MPTTSVITLSKFLDSAPLQHRNTLLMAYHSVVTLSPGIWRMRNINAGQATSSPVSFGAMRNTQRLTIESCYVNSYFQPAFFDRNDIQNEIDRMSSEFGQQARIIQMPQREGLPSAVMAIWGAIQLEPLKPDEISIVASGGSPPGILVSLLGDEERSAKAGVPVYRLAGGAGFLWVATFDQTGRGVLQYLAIDDSKIELSRQVASNSENQAESNSSAVNQPVVTQPGLQQQSRSQTEDAQTQAKEDLYRQEEENRQVEESDRQLKVAQQLSEAQSRRLATITEVAITIFVFLCGVAVAFFLRVKRQTAPQ
jgi:hypothetical protein